MKFTIVAFSALFLGVAAPALAAKAGKPSAHVPDPTVHVYRELLDGGAEEVVANDFVPKRRIAVLRASLRREALEYARGRYSDPDGTGAAAVAKLSAEARRVSVSYGDLPRGGHIVFRTKEPTLVAALHAWMAATVRYEQRIHHDGGPGDQAGPG